MNFYPQEFLEIKENIQKELKYEVSFFTRRNVPTLKILLDGNITKKSLKRLEELCKNYEWIISVK